MGKGDRKTKKGKIHIGSYGVRRPKKNNIATPTPTAKKKTKKAAAPKATKAAAPKATKAKKPAATKAKATKATKEKAEEPAE